MTVVLLDTDILIDVQRGHPSAEAWFRALTEIPSIPGFVVMELVQDARNALEAALRLSTGIGLLDSLIAATAIGHGATLYSFNAKHYRAVPHLTVVQPYVR